MLKMYLILKSYAWLVQFLEQPVLYRLLINLPHLVPIKEK